MKLVIFDLDGTLFRTETVDVEAVNRALNVNGFQARTETEILALIGTNMDEFCQVLLGAVEESQRAKFESDILRFEKELIETYGRLYEGVEQLLQRLCEAGYTLCICSNGQEDYVKAVLGRFELIEFFSDIRFYISGISKTQAVEKLKQKYDVDSFVMVGDRSSDIIAARENGGVSVGVTYGFGKNEVYEADYIAESTEEIEKIILNMN